MTESQRANERRRSRRRRKERYRSDPEYRLAILAKKKAWTEKKRLQFPQYKRLEYLTSTINRLREQIDRHRRIVEEEDQRLLDLVKEAQSLRKAVAARLLK